MKAITHVGILRTSLSCANTTGLRAAVFLVGSLIVSACIGQQHEPPTETAAATAEQYLWDFSRQDDIDSNKWPDRWQRRQGRRYPKYVKLAIVAREPLREQHFRRYDAAILSVWSKVREYASAVPTLPPVSMPIQSPWQLIHNSIKSLPALPPSLADTMVDRYLRVDLDGGLAMAKSFSVPTSHLYQYQFRCDITTERLHHDRARAELVFLNADGEETMSQSTEPVTGTTDWTTLTIERTRPPIDAKQMMVRIIIDGSDDGLEDIYGSIGFDNLVIEQFPQLEIVTNQRMGVYEVGKRPTATAKIMGLPDKQARVRFRVLDIDNRELASASLEVERPKVPALERKLNQSTEIEFGVDSEVTWELPRLDVGFYRVVTELEGNQRHSMQAETTLVMIDTLIDGPPEGSFGWTLPNGVPGVSSKVFAPWLERLGVAWVKYPCWLAPDDIEGAERATETFGRLQDAGIQTCGMLDSPPDDQIQHYDVRNRGKASAAQLFRDERVWQPLLEPLMTRLSLKVQTWQLGADRDHSFLGRPRLSESVNSIASGLQGFGQPVSVVLSWPWMESQLPSNVSSLQAVIRSSNPPLGANELDSFLEVSHENTGSRGPRTWLLLDPISEARYDRDARIRDLVLRMATVRKHAVQAAYVSDPFDQDHGLLREDGRPGELLLPWRTTARLIGDLRPMGRLSLRSQADNIVFAGDDRTVVILWSAEPTEELAYLGENVRTIDVWGRSKPVPIEVQDGHAVQRLKIGPTPIFVVGADPVVLAFRMSVELDKTKLDSLLGTTQQIRLSFGNSTPESIAGAVSVRPPTTWSIPSNDKRWKLLSGRNKSVPFDIVLGNSTTVGEYELGFDFDLQTAPPRRFVVHRRINVGPDGLEIKAMTRIIDGNVLRVRVEITNNSDRDLAYDCNLFPPPGRQHQRRDILIAKGKSSRRDFYWTDGTKLVGGKMLLRAIEHDGQRVLNYSIDVRQ